MNLLITSSDFFTLLPAIIPCIGALCILLLQVSLPKYRSSISYWLSLFFLSLNLFIITLSLGWFENILSNDFIIFLSSFSNMIISASSTEITAFGGQISWGREQALYAFAIVSVSLLILLMARKVLSQLKLNLVEAYQMMLFSISGLILFICSNNLIIFFISLELSSLPIFVLAGWDRKMKSCNEAGIKYFLLSSFSIAFILLGIAFIYGACGSINFTAISQYFEQENLLNNINYLRAGFLLLIFGLAFKIALFPSHAWVADVYEGSITIVTTFMAALIKIASIGVIFKLLKIFVFSLPVDPSIIKSPISLILITLSVASMFYGNITALTQQNIKRLLAYSSIAHTGYMASLFPLAFLKEYADEASTILLFYVVGYAISSTLSFGVISFLELSEQTSKNQRKVINLNTLKGLFERRPYVAFLLSISMFSFAGIPPLVGFYGKFYILKILINAKMHIVAILVSVNSLIAICYYMRIFFYSYWFKSDDTDSSKKKVQLFDFASWVSVTLLVTITITLGLLSGLFMQ